MARPVATPRSTIPSQGWQELLKGLTQRGSGKGVADRNARDGSQKTPQPTCSPYRAPLSLSLGGNFRAYGYGRNGTLCDSKGKVKKAAQLLSGELQPPHTLEASPPTQLPF